MSDYKSIIKGTLNSLGEKAKDLAESGKVKEIYDKGTEKAKVLSRIAKRTLEYNGEGEDLKKAYMEIGKLYYEENSANPQGFFAPLFEKVREISGQMSVTEKELAALKEMAGSQGDSFEDVVSKDENEK